MLVWPGHRPSNRAGLSELVPLRHSVPSEMLARGVEKHLLLASLSLVPTQRIGLVPPAAGLSPAQRRLA